MNTFIGLTASTEFVAHTEAADFVFGKQPVRIQYFSDLPDGFVVLADQDEGRLEKLFFWITNSNHLRSYDSAVIARKVLDYLESRFSTAEFIERFGRLNWRKAESRTEAETALVEFIELGPTRRTAGTNDNRRRTYISRLTVVPGEHPETDSQANQIRVAMSHGVVLHTGVGGLQGNHAGNVMLLGQRQNFWVVSPLLKLQEIMSPEDLAVELRYGLTRAFPFMNLPEMIGEDWTMRVAEGWTSVTIRSDGKLPFGALISKEPIENLKTLVPMQCELLREAGFHTIGRLLHSSIYDLTKIPDIKLSDIQDIREGLRQRGYIIKETSVGSATGAVVL